MTTTNRQKGGQAGFTIVELLIVVVVIAILAAITIVSYNGITERARVSVVDSGLVSVKKKIEAYRVLNGTDQYPGDLASIELPNTSTQFRYAPNNATRPYGFCLQSTQNNLTHYITESSEPASGPCDENFGIVGWWRFNGNYDDSGLRNWPTAGGSAPTAAVGQRGQSNTAYSFNGTNQALNAGGFSTSGVTYGAVSLSGWVYPQNNPASARGYFGVRSDSGTAPQYSISQRAGANTLECRVWTSTAGSYVDAGNVSVVPDTWNFVVLVYDGTNARCYVNGTAGTNTATTGSFLFTAAESSGFRMGRVGTNYFSGRLDDIRAYARVLSEGEIQAMYAAGAQ